MQTKVLTICPKCQRRSLVILTFGQYGRYLDYLHKHYPSITEALPDVEDEQRIQLLSGICPKCWKKLEEETLREKETTTYEPVEEPC